MCYNTSSYTYYNVLKYTVIYIYIYIYIHTTVCYLPSPQEAQSHSDFFKRKQRKPGAEVLQLMVCRLGGLGGCRVWGLEVSGFRVQGLGM